MYFIYNYFDVMLFGTCTAFSHIRDSISIEQKDRFHCRSQMVELTKAHPNNCLCIISVCIQCEYIAIWSWTDCGEINADK